MAGMTPQNPLPTGGGGFVANRAGGMSRIAAPVADAPAVPTPLSAPPPQFGAPTYSAMVPGAPLPGTPLPVPGSDPWPFLTMTPPSMSSVVQQLNSGLVGAPLTAPPAAAAAASAPATGAAGATGTAAAAPPAGAAPPAAAAPAPAQSQGARQPITVIRGGQVDEGGGGGMSRYDLAQLQNMASSQPRISPMETAQHQIIGSYQQMRDLDLAAAERDYQKDYIAANGDPAKIKGARAIMEGRQYKATTAFLDAMKNMVNPQLMLMDALRQQQQGQLNFSNGGMP